VEVSVSEVYRGCPIPRPKGMANILQSVLLELGSVQVIRVQLLQVDDGPHPSILLGD
jgi:hypothetical protein